MDDIPVPNENPPEENLDLFQIPINVQLKILKKFHNYQDLANIEESCKLLADLVNEVGYIIQAERVSIDEETEYIIANRNQYQSVGSFTERKTKILCEELDFSYTDVSLLMDESRQIEAVQAIENNDTRGKRLILNIPISNEVLFNRLLMATQPKQLIIWSEINPDLLKHDYVYEKIEQLLISEETEIVEEEILKFTARELTIMNGVLTLPGLLQIATVFSFPTHNEL